MERKVKVGFGVNGILSIPFLFLGLFLIAVGLGLLPDSEGSAKEPTDIIVPLIGAVFVSLAVVLLGLKIRQKVIATRLVRDGRYIWGKVTQIGQNHHITVNGRHPFVLIISCRDPMQKEHTLRSRDLYRIPSSDVLGRNVRIYYENEDFRHYYIDLESVLDR